MDCCTLGWPRLGKERLRFVRVGLGWFKLGWARFVRVKLGWVTFVCVRFGRVRLGWVPME